MAQEAARTWLTKSIMDAFHESPNLDFLRSFAVLSVLGFHTLLLFEQRQSPYVRRLRLFHSIGHWGVLIFFVHTSLVLMFSLERQRLRFPNEGRYLPFITRRIFRIFPLSLFVVLAVSVLRLPVAYLTAGRFEPAHLPWTGIVSNCLLLQNLTHTDSVIVPLWSLPYEMQMYLFLPALFALASYSRNTRPIILVWLACVLAGIHAIGLERLGVPDLIVYAPCFLGGVLAYRLTKGWRLKLPSTLWPIVLASLTFVYLKTPNDRNAWYCCLLLGIAIPQIREIRSPFTQRMFHLIARYSYGIYLAHFICIWIAFEAIRGVPEYVRWIVLVVTVIVFPVALYHVIEQPMIRTGEKVTNALRSYWSKRHVPALI